MRTQRRIIAISSDAALGERFARALDAAGSTTEVFQSLDALGTGTVDAALCVCHLDGAFAPAALAARLSHGCQIAFVLPHANVAAVILLMGIADNTVAVFAADALDDDQLTAFARRVITQDLFGLAKTVPGGTQVHEHALGDYRARGELVSSVTALATEHRFPRRVVAAIEQSIDELLMNALYDAPVDEDGRHVFADVPVETRVRERIDQRVIVECAFDGRRFTIAVRDAFGSLERSPLMRALTKCLHADEKVDRKAGGAGVGVFLMANEASALSFHVVPGLATEVVCTFDVTAEQPRLGHFAIVVERIDVTGKLVSGRKPAAAMRRISMGPKDRRVPTSVIAAGAASAIGLAVVAALWTRGGNGDDGLRALRPMVRLDSVPSGASVEIGGKPAGETPLLLTPAPGTEVVAKLTARGYVDATARVQIPAPGAVTTHVEPLVPAKDFVRVRFESTPPGARIVRVGAPPSIDRSYTPAEVFVEANKPHRFMLFMPEHQPLAIEPFTPAAGSGPLTKRGALAPLSE